MQHFTFHPRLILRTPRETFIAETGEAAVRSYVQNEAAFREALYLASPRLFSAVSSASDLPEKLLLPLARYVVRNRYRATPFGLFSGVGTVQWGSHTRLSLKAEFCRHTRLDMDYLCALAADLERDPRLQEQLVYYPNSSLYFLGQHLRYVERNGAPVLSSVKSDPYVRAVLEKAVGGVHFFALITALEERGISREEAGDFLRDMADNQLIVSELEPTVTGSDFLDLLIGVLNRTGHPAAVSLGEIRVMLRQLDDQATNDPAAYAGVINRVRQLGTEPDESRLFHTVRVNATSEAGSTLSCEYQEEIRRAIQKLGAFAVDGTSAAMHDFISRFQERYEDEEVPLLTALDTESGIGYRSHVSEDFTPLTEGISLPLKEKNSSDLKWKQLQKALFRSLLKAREEGAFEIPLPDLLPAELPVLAPSFSVMFRLVDQHRLFIESIGGSSATQLAGRFGHASEEIGEILSDIHAAENEHNPGVIFAEIAHLPESRTGNILNRLAFRSHEIPYLAQAGVPSGNRISLRDLYVSVRNGQVVLRHENQRVIPRLGCAHNFRSHSLPVYHFLCDLQTQGFQNSLEFSWGDIAREFVFLPRVADGRVIISPAMWQLSSVQLEAVQQPALTPEDFEHWQARHAIPRCFVLAEGDNELFIDTSQPLLRRVFLDSLQGKSHVLLKEFLGHESIPVRDAAGQPLVNQFIAFLIRHETVYKPLVAKHPEHLTAQRTFSLGSEWLYLKLYCGAKSADLILENGIAPIVRVAEMNGWTDQWFFIRYHDPDNHLRVRLHLTDTGFLPDLLRLMEYHIQPFQKSGGIWKIQADTYRRELERYGHEAITAVERLFSIDSRMYLDFLCQTEGDDREELKWLWGLRNIEGLLQAAGLDLPARKALMEDIRRRFADEFGMERNLKSQIDRRYRAHRSRIDEFMKESGVLQEISLAYEPEIRDLWNGILEATPEKAAFEQIITSCIHMTVNRLISSGQRLHELIMYDFLGRYYTTLAALTDA